MALNGALLGSQIAAAVQGLSPAEKADVSAIWTAVANAIVTHITSQGVVTVAVTTTGSASAQAGTGTGTVS